MTKMVFLMKPTRNNIGHLLRIYTTTDGAEKNEKKAQKNGVKITHSK